ncbi:hypothetical protein [Oceanicoccus sp. KOV_DT_Chl]|uniref:hypothetical protein n=1 Tax=Oceanicoccus sp. KOV_DT_Chl TaxID=1904639 RepID=UPI000C7C5495|nr:hypothetical protein [Oceanicoccus sp. KOV_DT_Chl]
MATLLFWNRRSGSDRRQHQLQSNDNRQRLDRRQLADNHYQLFIAHHGFDRFELFSLSAITLLLTAMLLGL